MATIIDIDVTQTTQAVTITAEPNEYIVNINTGGGGGGTQDLQSVTDEGNTTTNDIQLIGTAGVVFDNGSKVTKGTIDAGNSGYNGIALKCSADYELKWEAGRLYVMEQGGFTIRETRYNFNNIPTTADDDTLGYIVGSRWILDNGDVYSCTDNTTGAAVWELLEGVVPTLQQVTDELNETTNDIIINKEWGQISLGNIGLSFLEFLTGKTTLYSSNFIINNETGYCFPDNPIGNGYKVLATLDDIPTSSGIPHTTAAGTDTYTATITGVAAYADGDAYLIRFTNGNTEGCTLNINSLGAKTLYRNNDGVLIGGDIQAGAEMLCVYNSSLNAFQCIGTAPNTLLAYVTNDDTVTLTKGMAVYAFSGTGDRMTVKRASNTSDATSAQTVGLVLSASIAPNQKGIIITQGLLDGLSILPTSTWTDGDAVYLGATAGTITNVKPFAPNHLVYLGTVTAASNGSAGRLYVRVQNGYELQELHNVQAQSPSLKDTLWYDSGVSPGQWKTASIPTILGYTPQNTATLLFDSIEKGILRSNYFWFLPNAVTSGQAVSFGYSERIAGTYTLSGNGNLTRGMTAFNTSTTPGNIAFLRRNDSVQLQGLEAVFTRKIQFNSNVSGQRFFCGISKGNQFAAPTNVDQTTLTDIVGVVQLSTSTNMHVIHNDASGTATTIDLGSSYPCNDSQYNYYITIEQTTTSYIVTVERVTISTGASISTINTLSTNIPVYNTGIIQLLTWITNNAQSSVASYLDGGAIGYLKNV